jgi:hypothetical protein
MRTKTLLSVCVTAGLALTGCGDKDDGGTQSVPMTVGDETGGNDSITTSQPGDGDGDGDSADETGGDDGDDDNGSDTNPSSGFIDTADGGTASIECDVWGQDCPEGQKCMPWDNSGQGAWNATKCTPLDPNPAQVGDECTVEGSGISGIDNCTLASMCWAVDPETNLGTCVAFCSGTEANPQCDNPDTTCSITNSGVLILCLPSCDPLAQDCDEGQACYGVGPSFICAPNASGADLGNYGDPCEYLNVCNPGLFCAGAAGVPGCQGSQGCCSEFCSLSHPDGNEQCTGSGGGQNCVPWFEDGQAPPAYLDVGGCVIPA